MAEPDGPGPAEEGSGWPVALCLLAFLALTIAVVVASFWLLGEYAAAVWCVLIFVLFYYGLRENNRKRREALEELSRLPIEVQRRIMVDVFFGLGRKGRR